MSKSLEKRSPMAKTQPTDDGVLAELRRWGGPAEMSAFEALMWLAEVDPRLRSTTTSVLTLDLEPDWDRFLADHQWLADAVPRFRQRVVVPTFGVGHPTWVDDPDFELSYHVRRHRLPSPGSERQLLDAAAILAMTPFDRAKPPWEATLFEGLEGGRAAYVLKLHHAVSDGLGIMQLLSRVFTRDRAAVVRPQPPARDRGRVRVVTSMGLGIKALASGVASLPRSASNAASALARHAGNLVSDSAATKESLDYLISAKRMVGNKPVPGSPLFRRRSLSWRFDTIELPLAAFKAAAKAVEGSVNDCFLSGLIGGFRRYHEQMGVAITEMPVGFPISLRTGDDPLGGNKFAGSQYDAPVAEKDPVERIRHIQRFVRETRAEPALDVMIRLTPLLTRLPMAAVTRLMAGFTAAQDAQISNIPGIPFPVFLAGAEVTHYWPFAPTPGCGMMIAMLSHNGRCCIGMNSDAAAVTEPELLVACLREGLDEVIALGQPDKKTPTDASAAPRRPARKTSKPTRKVK
ncbi:MAG TPA: wax ester/triacylglycerol synthase domain-containing protein [Caldimonas sp.]|nr:wax ester/triacylglycerol synthase domain-containing protein [Caldimonas sp.]HEV7575223.1 wax ester/triacylglycerol synthase domain-containing protein [Caldimonas sp.]